MTDNNFDNKTISIVGLGGVGTIIANRLVRNNCALRIIDRDRIYVEEIPRQNLYTLELKNKFKAKEAKKLLDTINPEANVKSFHEDLTEENSFLLQGDLIIDCSNDKKTNKVVQKKAEADKLKVVQINYAENKALIKFYEGKTKDSTFKETISELGCAIELPEIASGVALHVVDQVLSGNKVKPEYKIDTKKLTIN